VTIGAHGLKPAIRDDRLPSHGEISREESGGHSKAEGSGTEGGDDAQAESGCGEGSNDAQAARGRTQGRYYSEASSRSRESAGHATRTYDPTRRTRHGRASRRGRGWDDSDGDGRPHRAAIDRRGLVGVRGRTA
jgi:hypothetical protein